MVTRGGYRIPCRRGRQLLGGEPTYEFAGFPQKLHEIKKILVRREGAPLRSATGYQTICSDVARNLEYRPRFPTISSNCSNSWFVILAVLCNSAICCREISASVSSSSILSNNRVLVSFKSAICCCRTMMVFCVSSKLSPKSAK